MLLIVINNTESSLSPMLLYMRGSTKNTNLVKTHRAFKGACHYAVLLSTSDTRPIICKTYGSR